MEKIFITLLIAGLVTGLALAGIDLLNPNTSAAEAERTNMETTHQNAVYDFQEKLLAAQTESEIHNIQRAQQIEDAKYAHDVRVLEQDIVHRDVAFKTWMTVLTVLAGALALTLLIGATIWMGSEAWVYIHDKTRKEETVSKTAIPITMRIPNLPERAPYDPWHDPTYRRQKRVDAQQVEQKNREDMLVLAARLKAISDAVKMSVNDYNSLPLAGD
jgi:hypothetical protein